MKFLACSIALLAIISKINAKPSDNDWPKAARKKMKKYGMECLTTNELTPELIDEALNRQIPDDPLFKKFLLCVTQKTGMIDANGKPVESDIRRKLEKIKGIKKEEVDKVMKKCVVDKGSPEETSYYVAKCLNEEEPKLVPVNLDDTSSKDEFDKTDEEKLKKDTEIPASRSDWDQQVHKKLEKYGKECAKTNKVTPDVIEAARNRSFPNDPLFKKFLLCLTQKTGMIDASGKPVISNIRRKLERVEGIDKEKDDSIMNECVMDKGSPEETAYYVARCIDINKPDFVPVD